MLSRMEEFENRVMTSRSNISMPEESSSRTLPSMLDFTGSDHDWKGSFMDTRWINKELCRSGALLFRGSGITRADGFERAALLLISPLYTDNGEHQRDRLSEGIYTPVPYSRTKKLLWHNENSFNLVWPGKILFCCLQPASTGGETPLVNSRLVLAAMNSDLRQRFAKLGVMYVRNYGGELGLSWEDVFGSSDPARVEARCREEDLSMEWLPGNRLRTSCVRPAIVEHPSTGEPVFFAQPQHWHVSCLDAEVREGLLADYPPNELPRSCFFGDGSSIPDRAMQHICEIYRRFEVVFPWQAGDILLIDNILTAHARNPYDGERKLLVAMGEMQCYQKEFESRGQS